MGLVTFYGIGDSKFKNKVILQKQYITQSMTKVAEPFPVTAVKFDKESQILLLGDEFGNIQGWLLSRFLDALALTKIQKSVLVRRKDTKQNTNVKYSLNRNLF